MTLQQHTNKTNLYGSRLSDTSGVFLAAVLEYLMAELLEGSRDVTRNAKARRPLPELRLTLAEILHQGMRDRAAPLIADRAVTSCSPSAATKTSRNCSSTS